jgi:hypothetical protein
VGQGLARDLPHGHGDAPTLRRHGLLNAYGRARKTLIYGVRDTPRMARPADIAKRAAAAYYGLSSDPKKVPKGWDVEYVRGDVPPETPFLVELGALISTKWNDNIGSESRTARMSDLDFLVYANELLETKSLPKVSPGDPRIASWMAHVASRSDDLVLVRLVRGDERKLLLVNTAITQ